MLRLMSSPPVAPASGPVQPSNTGGGLQLQARESGRLPGARMRCVREGGAVGDAHRSRHQARGLACSLVTDVAPQAGRLVPTDSGTRPWSWVVPVSSDQERVRAGMMHDDAPTRPGMLAPTVLQWVLEVAGSVSCSLYGGVTDGAARWLDAPVGSSPSVI